MQTGINFTYKRLGIGFWIYFSVVLIVIVCPFYVMHCPPFNLKKLERLRVGMPKIEVLEMLGKPSAHHDGTWIYDRPFAWPMVEIYFDTNGELTGYLYDD